MDWYRRYLNEVSFYVILFPMVRNERCVQHRGLDSEGWAGGGGCCCNFEVFSLCSDIQGIDAGIGIEIMIL